MKHSWAFLEIFSREGGIQSYVKDIWQAYGELAAAQGYHSQVFLLRDRAPITNPFQSDRVRFHYYASRSAQLGRLKLATGLARSLLLNRPQRVLCGHIKLAPLTRLLCQPLGIPYTVLTYGKEVWDMWEMLTDLERQSLHHAASIWTISRYSRDRICEAHRIPPTRVQLLPCVVDGERFQPGSKPVHLLERYQLQGAKVLMTVSRLWAEDIYKGVDVTIRALPQIAQAIPNVKYLVIGRGDDQPRLAQLAQEMGVGDRVVFAGFVSTPELPDHYRVADAYTMPSQEGFGIVYLEAMASGIPALSGLGDGSADPLQDSRVGWQVPHRDVDAVAAGCIEMLRGEEQRCDGEWLRSQALEKFGRASLTQRLVQLLELD
ncbi:MAG: glycosyltransferase family 4 protein [Spirulina sp. SIO3F2]|nr:glycosyltransferase family 4 protein [Spirulina sp. SIO3F2]